MREASVPHTPGVSGSGLCGERKGGGSGEGGGGEMVFEVIRAARWRGGIAKRGGSDISMGCPAPTCCKTLLWALSNPPCSSQPFISLGAMAFSERGGERLAFPIHPSSEDPLRVAKVWLSLWGGHNVAPVPCRCGQ